MIASTSPAAITKASSSSTEASSLPGPVASSTISSPTESIKSSGSVTGTAGIAAQNPFDQVISLTPLQGAREALFSPLDDSLLVPSFSEGMQAPVSPTRSAPHTTPAQSPVLLRSAPSTPLHLVDPIPRQPQSAPPISSAISPLPSSQTQVHAATELRHTSSNSSGQPRFFSPQPQPIFDDDENTQPSSTANTTDQGYPVERTLQPLPTGERNSFVRFMQNTRKRLGSAKDSDDGEFADGDGTVICGYLQKLGRNGKWQTRWFETDGECLSYYKSSKRSKLLATLDLEKVGAIEVDDGDPTGCSFKIQVLGRLYHLRAENRASCKDWVISLNRVKEARLQQGNVKLVEPNFQTFDLLDHSHDVLAPRIVVVTNRERTRAVDEAQEWDRLMIRRLSEDPADPATMQDMKRRSTIGTVVLARWSKRKSVFSRLGMKLAKWARSVRKYGCGQADSVELDRHVHPPGHDYHRNRSRSSSQAVPHPVQQGSALDAWIEKETHQGSGERTSIPSTIDKPQNVHRGVSDVSEDGARYLS